MIAITIFVVICIILVILLLRRQEKYITVAEVIPEGRILSHEEGIVEYQGIQFILGTGSLRKKKEIIETLDLTNFNEEFVIDLRFDTQVIITKGPFSKKNTGPGKMQ